MIQHWAGENIKSNNESENNFEFIEYHGQRNFGS